MSEIFIPPNRPPQISEAVAGKLLVQAITEGVSSTYSNAEYYMREIQPTFREFLYDGLENSSILSDDEISHKREFRAGAMIAGFAYVESGYHVPMEEKLIDVGILEAKFEGLPNVFHTRTATDLVLLHLIRTLPREEVGLGAGMYSSEYENILSQGAGCARFMLQQAMAA